MRRAVLGGGAGFLAVWAWLAFFSGTGWRMGAPGYARPAFAEQHAGARTVDFDKLVEKLPVGDVLPARCIIDPYAAFNGIAVDPANDFVVMTAPNIRAIMLYRRTSGGSKGEVTRPLGQLMGPATHMSGAASVAVDPGRKQFYGIETDIGDNVAVFSYDDRGDAKARTLAVPLGGWGIALNLARDEMVVSIEDNDELIVYRRAAQGVEHHLRQIRGLHTTLADPKGLAWDEKNHEIIAANEGNWSRSYWDPDYTGGGEYRPPSIVVFDEMADKDAKPKRIIQGPKTGLDFPHGVVVDNIHDEIAVNNDGDNSVAFFSRTASGDVAPIRVIKGPHTEIAHPMGLALDTVNDEIWVANWDHAAQVFDRSASGDVAPKRVIRSAPPGTPTTGLSVSPALGFDTKRDQLLAPNWAGEPRIAAFARMANGNAGPERVIGGQKSKLVRYSHGVLYDPAHDETFASEPQTSAILVFRGEANGEEGPIRVIQGSKTRLHGPWQMALDLKHDELYVADFMGNSALVFPRGANGNVAPVRVIEGRKSGMSYPSGVAVDVENNLVVVATLVRVEPGRHENGALFVYNRTDNGNVPARAIIGGPKTGIFSAWHVATHQGHIFATIVNFVYKPAYDLAGFACWPGVTQPPAWVWTHPLGFLGVWRETDNGDVPPRGIIRGGDSGLYGPMGLVINPQDGEIYILDQRNQIYSFIVPQLFAPNL